MDRPAGVTVLSVLDFLGAAALLVCGAVFLVGMSIVGAAAKQQGGGAGPMALLMGLGAVGGVICLFFAVIAVVVGVGLWKLKNWARILTIVFDCVNILFALFGLVGLAINFHMFSLVIQLILLVFYGWVLWYMFQTHVKQAFGAA